MTESASTTPKEMVRKLRDEYFRLAKNAYDAVESEKWASKQYKYEAYAQVYSRVGSDMDELLKHMGTEEGK